MQPVNVPDLIERAGKAAGSEYKLAKLLGVSRQRVSNWKTGQATCSPEDQALIAAIAGVDAEEVLVRAVLAKHANTPKGEKLLTALGNAARRIGETVTSAFFASAGLALAGAWLPNKAEAATVIATAASRSTNVATALTEALIAFTTMCIMLNRKAANEGWLFGIDETLASNKAAQPGHHKTPTFVHATGQHFCMLTVAQIVGATAQLSELRRSMWQAASPFA